MINDLYDDPAFSCCQIFLKDPKIPETKFCVYALCRYGLYYYVCKRDYFPMITQNIFCNIHKYNVVLYFLIVIQLLPNANRYLVPSISYIIVSFKTS